MRGSLLRLVLVLALVLSMAGAAVASPALPRVQLKPRPELLVVEVIPAEGSHLAADLPLRAEVDDGEFSFSISEPAPPSSGPGRVRLPLIREKRITGWTVQVEGATCADDGTTCAPFHAEATLPPGGLRVALPVRAGRLPRPEPVAPPTPPPPPAPPMADRLVLIDFFATWCPPCDRLRDEFLEAPAWEEFLDDYTVRSVDADDPSSFALKDRYQVGGYPTLLVTTPGGEVLERIVGFPGAEAVAERISRAAVTRPAVHDSPCAASWPAVRLGVARGKEDAARDVLASQCPDRDAFLDEAAESPWIIRLAWELALDAEDPAALALAAPLVESLPLGDAAEIAEGSGAAGDASALRARVIQRIEEALPAALPDATARIDLANALYYAGTWDAERAAAWHPRALELMAEAIAIRHGKPLPTPLVPDGLLAMGPSLGEHEGLVHDVVYLLEALERHGDAARFYRAMQHLRPDDFTWFDGQAAHLQSQGILREAVILARAALDRSYGDTRLRAAHRLATILAAQGDPETARTVIDEALAAAPPDVEHVRTWRYRERLETLRASLDSSAAP